MAEPTDTTQAAPEEIDEAAIRARLAAGPGIADRIDPRRLRTAGRWWEVPELDGHSATRDLDAV